MKQGTWARGAGIGTALGLTLFLWQKALQWTDPDAADSAAPAVYKVSPLSLPESAATADLPGRSGADIRVKAPADTGKRDAGLLQPDQYETRSGFGPLPRSLQGTVPVRLGFDQNGDLLLSPDVTHLFEYFLSAVQDEGMQTVLARINEYLQLSLPASAAEQALALLEDYLAYKQQLEAVAVASVTEVNREQILQDLKTALDARATLRDRIFTPAVATKLFGADAAYDEYTWQSANVLQEQTLTDEEKDRRLSELEDHLPATIRERVRYQRQERQVQQQISELQRQGAADDQLHAVREAFYGEAVADRWRFIEAQTPEWEARVKNYQKAAAGIRADHSLDADARQARLAGLRQESFSAEEHVKLALHELRNREN
jgi:lipase chaperone LimK